MHKTTSPQIGDAPCHRDRRERYLRKYKNWGPKPVERSLVKTGIQELEPYVEKPRKSAPHYLSGNHPVTRSVKIEPENTSNLTIIRLGEPNVVMIDRQCRTPTIPSRLKIKTSMTPKSHTSTREYDHSKSLSWKYYGEVDNQMGCLTEHIRVRQTPRLYAHTALFSSRNPSSLLTTPTNSSSRFQTTY